MLRSLDAITQSGTGDACIADHLTPSARWPAGDCNAGERVSIDTRLFPKSAAQDIFNK
jgi:hypothetical protein